MRPKIVIAVLLAATGVLGLAVLLPQLTRPKLPGVMPGPSSGATVVGNPEPMKVVSVPAPPAVSKVKPAVAAPPVVQPAPPIVNVHDRVAELMALAMNNDSNSLAIIWSELANPDQEIRAGALAAVVQFGDRSVTPRLRELAAQTEEAKEKADINAAADYLELPSLTEIRNNQSTNSPASR